MATTRSFQTMLNEYLPNDLLKEELIKRDWFLTNVEKDDNWKGGDIIVPFQGAQATSTKFGGLTDSTDVSEFKYVRGKISGYKEVWGTLLFNHTDLIQHDGKVKESTFLKILPNQVDQFIEYMKMLTSINLLAGPHFAKATANLTAGGVATVDRIDRFELGQKSTLDDDDSSQVDVYCIAINVNTSQATFSLTRGGAAADLSAYSLAQNAKFYHDGILVAGTPTNMFTSIKSSLLSLANGGSASLHGQTKLSYPYLQAVNIDGSTMTAVNILEKLFDAFARIRILAKAGKADKCVMSYKHLANCMKALEVQKGAFKVTAGQTKVSQYNWTEIEVMGVKGSFTLVGIQEADDDVIMFLDMNAMTFRSNGFFRKRTAPDGKQYYEIRSTSGYSYLLDVCLFGELEVTKPTACGIIYGITYA
jgi:hypothetical protein